MRYDYVGFYRKHVEDLRKESTQYKGWCPFHDDKSGGQKGFSLNPENGLWFCHSCGYGGNTIQFCKRKRLDSKQAPDYDPNHHIFTYPGGITKKKSKQGKNGRWGGTEGKGLPGDLPPWNSQAIDQARQLEKPLWICEGEKDVLTMLKAGELAVGLPSASMTKVLRNCSLDGIPEVIIACDNDKAGREASEQILKWFPFANSVVWPEDKPKGFDVSNLKEEDQGGFVVKLKEWADPYERQIAFLTAKRKKDFNRDPGELVGYRLTKFETLAKNIDGVQPGFYIVGAETNTGKTAFLCNLTLNLLDSNGGLAGLYFSLDDSREVIVNRLLSIRTGIPLNEVQKRQSNEENQEELTDGYTHLTNLSKQERLLILDASSIQDVDQLELEIKRYAERKLFVVVDALYNLDVGGGPDSLRRENIERASRLKALATIYQLPVICTGELRKKERKEVKDKPPIIHDLMETGKFAYNADLVLLLYPEKWDEYDKNNKSILKLKYAKNKLSPYRKTTSLRFHRNTGRLEEVGD